MNDTTKNSSASGQRQSLFTLCRFLSARFCYRFMIILSAAVGVLLTLCGQSLFAPYGISLVCLILPSFLSGSSANDAKKENNDNPLSVLYKRYHYSLSSFHAYRISLLLGMVLQLAWYITQKTPLTLWGVSVPLLFLAVNLFLYPILSRILFLILHRRLMNGGF